MVDEPPPTLVFTTFFAHNTAVVDPRFRPRYARIRKIRPPWHSERNTDRFTLINMYL